MKFFKYLTMILVLGAVTMGMAQCAKSEMDEYIGDPSQLRRIDP